MPKTVVLYHGSCSDGFCAAWVAKKRLPLDTVFIPVNYNQPYPNEIIGNIVYILDFSYKHPVMSQLIGQAHAVCVLDHHESAQKELTFPSCSYEQWVNGEGRIYIKFDLNKSGGRLTWDHFYPNIVPNWLVSYTEDYDLWRKRLLHTEEISAAIRSYPYDFAIWDTFNLSNLILEGKTILRYEEKIIKGAIANAVEIVMDEYKILTVNATICISEIGGQLARGRPFGATYFIRGDGKRVYSLRSSPEGINVADFAKKRGGGGHPHAAGFTE